MDYKAPKSRGLVAASPRNLGHFFIMNYRKLYAEYYGITIPKDYEVHHIDQNRGNNDIKNLILLPKWLHREIHNCAIYVDSIKAAQFFYLDNSNITASLHSYFSILSELYGQLIFWSRAKEFEDRKRNGEKGNDFGYNYNAFRK